jgi:hypothetical protein
MMKNTSRIIQTIFLLSVSVTLIAAANLNQIFAQNPSNTDLNVLKGAITSTSNEGNATESPWILGGV